MKKYLKQILIDYTNSYEILTYKSGEQLLNNYPQNVDIFILDIQMANINGMDVARKIREIDVKNVEIIFITSLVEYIQEGHEVRAYRYLLKPIKYDDLEKHMIKCIKEIDNVNFYRCHKRFLVNLEYVESIKQYVGILQNKKEVPISRHRFKDTKNRFYKIIGDKLC